MKSFSIQNRLVGKAHEPFVIAEMSGNHNQSLDRALAIVEAAAQSGAHALKIQTYTADTMTIDLDEGEFHIADPTSQWKGASLYRLYQQAHTPWEWHKPIFDKAKSLGMIAFSTPFDATSVDYLESLQVPCYKIASFENTDVELIAKVAKTGKPLIISTGMASQDEIAECVNTAHANGCNDLALLKCTSSYPASPAQSHLRTIPHLAETFDCVVGLSDHTLGIGVAVASVSLGASVIEKHFTLNRAEGGVDSAFSLEPAEFHTLVEETTRAWQALGEVCYGSADEAEQKFRQFRRSLYVVQDMKSGDTFTSENVRAIRPGLGLPTKHLREILGRKAARDIRRGTPVAWDLL